MKKISINLVTWNGRRFLENLFSSLFEQTFRDFEVLVIDNDSDDGTVKWIKEHYPNIRIIQNSCNKGFARAHNQAIHFTGSEYVLMLNQDIILTKSYIEELVKVMDGDLQLGSCSGILLSVKGKPNNLVRESFTTTIDSAGLKIFKSRRMVDTYAGQDVLEYPNTNVSKIFGVSGALPLYRRSALEDIRIEKEYLDEDFHSYKEDVDLAWRLQLRGWSSATVSSAKAYHFRTAEGNERQGNIATLKNRFGKSKVSKLASLRNHLWTLVKNDHWSNVIRHAPFIVWYEMRKWGIVLLFEQKSLIAIWQFFTG